MSKIYLDLKICDLREECKKRNLDTGGLKVHLVERLTKYDKDIENAAKELAKKSEIKVDENGKSENIDEKTIADMKSLFKNCHEPENWESRTDVHLDFYSSDLNIVIDPNGTLVGSMFENGFEYMFGGVKANYGVKSGKVFYEIKILKTHNIRLDGDVGESSVIKVGWSSINTSLSLGDEELSYAYDGSGKKLTNGVSVDYGVPIKDGDVIGCFLEFVEESFIISFSINGVNQGEAFKTMIRELKENFMVPHIFMRNMIVKANFGGEENALFPPIISLQDEEKSDDTWILLGRCDPAQLLRGPIPSPSKAVCEVMMMCGLPSCGKTTWVDDTVKNNPDKFYNVLSTNAVLDKMKVMSLRKKCSSSRWEGFIQSATQCLNKLMEIAVTKRRNFILDQTNVYPAAQRRRMKTFEEFIRKAIIIVPSDDEYQRRMTQVITEEGKDVPESAVLQMKENFVIPEESCDLFNESIFVELQREEADKLVKKYNDEAKENNKKNSMEQSNGNDSGKKREEDEEEDISWMKADRVGTEDQPSTKKSRWNDECSEEKSSKSKEFGNWSTSSSHTTRRSEHKSDSDRGVVRSSHRTEDRYSTKDRSRSRDRREDRYRSGGVSGRDRGDKRERSHGRDRGDDDGGSRRGRSRERGTESRGSYGRENGASRSGGSGYEDRRRRFESDYTDSAGPRDTRSGGSSSRFQTGDTNVRGTRFGDAGGNEQRGASKYTEFNPYEPANIGGQFKPDRREYGSSSDRSGQTGLKSSGGTRATRWGGAIGDTTNTDNRYGASNYDPDDTSTAYNAYFDSNPQFSEENSTGYQHSTAFPQLHKPPSEDTPKYSQPYINRAVPPSTEHSYYPKSDTSPKFGQPYPIKTATAPYNSLAQFPKPDTTPKYGQPYVSKPNKPADEHTKFDNPYAAKPGQFGDQTSNKTDDFTKYDNLYSTKTLAKTDNAPPYDNPYKSAMSIPKFAQPYPSKLAPASVAPKYGMPSQSVKHATEYQSHGYDDQNDEYYDDYAGESNTDASQLYSSIGSQLASLRAASYNRGAEDAYSAPSRGGAQGAAGVGAAYNAAPSDTYSAPLPSAGAAYNAAPSNTATSRVAGAYNAAPSDAYNAPLPRAGAAYNAAPSNTATSRVAGAYNAAPSDAYIAPLPRAGGAYNAAPSNTYNTATSRVAGAYNAAPSDTYNTATSRVAGAYNAAPSDTYNTATSRVAGAYNAAPSNTYNTATSRVAGAYNAAPSDTYNTATSKAGGAYNSAPSRGSLYNSSSYDDSYESSYDAYNTSQNAVYDTNDSYGNPLPNTAVSFKTPQRGGGFKNTPSNSDAYNAGSSGAYTTRATGSYNNPSIDAYNATSSGAVAAGGAAAYKSYSSGAAYNTASSSGYASYSNTAPSAGYATPSSAGYSVTPSSAGYTTPSSTGYVTPSSTGYVTPSSTGYATPSSGGYYTPSSAPYGTAQYAGAYQAQPNSAYNTPTSSTYYTSPSSAYYTPSNSSYNTPVSGAYYTPPISAYYIPSSSAQRPEGAPKAGYNTPSSAKSLSNTTIGTPSVTNASYSNAAHGSYTNTPSGSYGNHNVPKSSTSLATATNAAYGSFTNPYSNYYENTSATGGSNDGGYQYYGQESTTNKPLGSVAIASDKSAPTTTAQSVAYGDYSQYYAQ